MLCEGWFPVPRRQPQGQCYCPPCLPSFPGHKANTLGSPNLRRLCSMFVYFKVCQANQRSCSGTYWSSPPPPRPPGPHVRCHAQFHPLLRAVSPSPWAMLPAGHTEHWPTPCSLARAALGRHWALRLHLSAGRHHFSFTLGKQGVLVSCQLPVRGPKRPLRTVPVPHH